MAQVSVTVHRGITRPKSSAAQTKAWFGSLPGKVLCLPGNTILLPVLQMLWAFPGGLDQAQKGSYEACLKK